LKRPPQLEEFLRDNNVHFAGDRELREYNLPVPGGRPGVRLQVVNRGPSPLREAGEAYTLHVIVLEEERLNQPFREHTAALSSDSRDEYFY
jgi:hypothetical protein